MDMTRKQKKREKDSWFFSKSLLQEINELSEEVDDELEKVKNGPQKRIEEEPTSIAAVSNSKEEKSRQGSVAPKILPMKIKEEISDSQKLKDENHQLRKQLELLEKIQQDMLNNQSEVTAITKKLTVQNEQLERENKKLSDKISEEEKDELMNQELIYERQQLKDKVLLLSRKIEELKPKMQQLLSEKEALISQNNTLTKKIEGLIPSTESTSNEADEKEFSQLKEALYAAHGNIIHLQEQATEEHHKFEILEKENMELTSTVESLHKKILEKKDIEHEQSKRLAIQNNQLIATAEQVNELNKKIAELQGTYDVEKQKTQRLEKKIEQQEKDKLFHQEEVSKILLSARKQGDGIIQDAQKQAEKIMLVAEEKIQKQKDESKELYRSLVASQQEYQIIYEKMEKQLLHFVKED
ncbi:hypothetical protein [Enterococcus sp. AZ163]|uniref:hypothetical protein n=1 Tax=Enterococcus sp. AZ163 TaxID=2774638 RepID=UPI003D278A5F